MFLGTGKKIQAKSLMAFFLEKKKKFFFLNSGKIFDGVFLEKKFFF